MKQKRLLDSFALIAYLNKENNFEKVRDVMAEAQQSGLAALPILRVTNDFECVVGAARLKAEYPLFYRLLCSSHYQT